MQELEESMTTTLEEARKEFLEAQAEMRAVRFINDIDKFLRGLVDEAAKGSTSEDRLLVLANGINKLAEYTKNEPARLRDRAVALNERVTVIEGTLTMVKNRKSSYAGRVEAIRRVVEGDTDPRHPEKISTVREAERIKKQKKIDS